jgi:hypothetical protein
VRLELVANYLTISKTATEGVPFSRMTERNDRDHHSGYAPGQLALFVAAAIVLLVFAWTFVHYRAF